MLALEPLLVARLEEISGLKGVYGLPELSALDGIGKAGPCVYLIFDGYRVLENSGNRQAARIETRWLAVVSVKSAAKSADGAPARSLAAPWVQAVLGKLLGWKAGQGFRELALAPAPRSEFAAGNLMFPLAFTCEHIVSADGV